MPFPISRSIPYDVSRETVGRIRAHAHRPYRSRIALAACENWAMSTKPRFSSTFIFEVGNLTDEFHRIDSEIAQRAREIPGFLGLDHAPVEEA